MSCPSRWTSCVRRRRTTRSPRRGSSVTSCSAPRSPRSRARKPPTQHSMDEELQLLTVHGVLHLLGYDHEEPDEKAEMFGLQAAIVDGWRGGEGPDRSVPGTDRLMSAPSSSPARSLLVVVAWLAACAEAGIARVSSFRAEEAVRSGPARQREARAGRRRPDPLSQRGAAGARGLRDGGRRARHLRLPAGVRRDLGGAARRHRRDGPRLVRRRRRLPAHHRPPAPAEHGDGGGVRPAAAGPDHGPDPAAADPHRQRAHARQGLPQGPVRLRGRAARDGRPRREGVADRGRRAPDGALGLRARRHPRARGDGAAHRPGRASSGTRPSVRRSPSRCAPASRASRSPGRTRTTSSGSCT